MGLAEMALAGNCGLTIDYSSDLADHAWYFGEDQARYLCLTESPDALLTAAAKANVSAVVLGVTGGDTLNLLDGITISLPNLRKLHEGWLPNYMAGA